VFFDDSLLVIVKVFLERVCENLPVKTLFAYSELIECVEETRNLIAGKHFSCRKRKHGKRNMIDGIYTQALRVKMFGNGPDVFEGFGENHFVDHLALLCIYDSMRYMARLLGVDYGTVRVGLALSDPERKLAFPKEVVAFDEALRRIEDVIVSDDVSEIVVGIPTPLSGKESDMTKQVSAFAEMLSYELSVSVSTWPELLSSREASHAPGGKKDDASAAAIVLQSYLDEQNRAKS